MLKSLIAAFVMLGSVVAYMPDVEAKPMGGRKSVGKQSPNVTKQQAPAQQSTQQGANNSSNQAKPANNAATPNTPAPAPASPWKGMLGGALLGLGLGALLSGMGIGAGMANIISMLLMAGLAIGAVVLLMRLFKRNTAKAQLPAYAMAGQEPRDTEVADTPQIGANLERNATSYSAASVLPGIDADWQIPSDFDVPAFERSARVNFLRLQAAWDKSDVNDIREFTTPEMYGELMEQLKERGTTPNVTDVLTINAKLLGIVKQGPYYLASVKFVGTMRDGTDAPTESFDEVWNLLKPESGDGGWLLAGIQQVEDLDLVD